jgi:hypothetical protein
MIKLLRGEIFKNLILKDELKSNYVISNYGRIVSYKEDIFSGIELNGSITNGFRVFNYSKYINGKRKSVTHLYSRLVASHFLPEPASELHQFVMHLDHNKLNNHVSNLKWATQDEVVQHNKSNPLVIQGRAKTIAHNIKADGRKLTSTQVIRIKKMLQRQDNKTRLVMIAKQFNITTQQLYRIKTGENWSHIKI